jgi:hypothetical protein
VPKKRAFPEALCLAFEGFNLFFCRQSSSSHHCFEKKQWLHDGHPEFADGFLWSAIHFGEFDAFIYFRFALSAVGILIATIISMCSTVVFAGMSCVLLLRC